MNPLTKIVALLASLILLAPQAFAAIGCTLSNPAADLKYLYPEMTSYKEEVRELPRLADGDTLYGKLRDRAGPLDPIYEAYDTPYTLYSVFKGDTRIGHVHGVNVPGRGGVIQLFVSTDPDSARIRSIFFQRLESPAGKALRDKAFRARFAGLTLGDFYKHDYYAVADPTSSADPLAKALQPPGTLTAAGADDFASAMRGLRKNLILLDIFAYGMRHEPFFEKAREALAARAATPPPRAPANPPSTNPRK